jgi:predicted Zn-dependent protease
MTEYAFEGPVRSSESITWSFATQNFFSDFADPFSDAISAAYQSTIQAAFAEWASVSGLTFTQVADSSSVAIRVGFGPFVLNGELGETDYRYTGGVFKNDTLIRLLDPAVSPLALDAAGLYEYTDYGATLMQVILHEIGHALGLDHTTDPSTIMYPYASSSNRDLAAGDIDGINALYPYPLTIAAVQPAQDAGAAGQTTDYTFIITRHTSTSSALTIDYTVSGAPYPTVDGSVAAPASVFVGGVYPTGTLSFAAGSATATLTIAVVGTSLAQPDQGFSIALSSPNSTYSLAVTGQANGVILDDLEYGQVNGNSLGVYRFFDDTTGVHFYSASEAERNTLIQTRPDLIYEGIGLEAVDSPSTDPAAVPVYRFFSVTNGTHFYSISAAERDNLLATRSDLTFEGTAFYEHAVAQTGDTPVYRFFDVTDGTHFYTASASERASILATRPDLHAEGIGFYAPSA